MREAIGRMAATLAAGRGRSASRRAVLAGTAGLVGGGVLAAGFGGAAVRQGPRAAWAQGATPVGGTPAASAGTPNAQMQAVLDELAALNPIPIESQTPFNARQLPSVADADQAILAREGRPAQEQVGGVTHALVPTPNGDLVARVYTPEGSGPFPVIVYFHGGGWVIANLDTYDASCRALCNAAASVVVSVAYRQAPEFPFPAPVDDAYFAFQTIAENAAEFGGDPARVAVAGESAGGNLATVTCLLAREQNGVMPVHQLLVYPVTTFLPEGVGAETIARYADAKPLGAALLEWFGAFYVPNEPDRGSPYASPLLATDLSGLPSATVVAAEIDPLLGQGRQYADALEAAGVDVSYALYEGVTHEFFGLGAVVDLGQEAVAAAAERLTGTFEGGGATPAA